MEIVGNFIVGVIMIAIGVLLLKNNYQVANNIPISFAERHIGSGGSYTLWKLLAILVVIAGLTVMFGVYDNILSWLVSPLTNMVNPGS